MLKYTLLPIAILFVSIILNIYKFEDAFLIPLIKVFLQASLIWGLVVLFQSMIIFRAALALFIGIKLFTQLAYGSTLSVGMLMSVLTTSPSESFAFIKFNLFATLCLLAFTIAMIFFPVPARRPINIAIFAGGLGYLVIPAIIHADTIFSSPSYKSYIQPALARGESETYSSVEYLIQADLNFRFPALSSIKGISDTISLLSEDTELESSWTDVISKETSPKILVLGIGESLRAGNMGLYGYNRDTTPHLSKLAGTLDVYKNTYAAGTNTWSAIPAALTKVSEGKISPNLSKSIINLAKDAGYETFWLSNQAKFGHWDLSISSIAGQADHVYFNSDEQAGVKYDISLISKLINTLDLKGDDKKILIVLHFFGSHMSFADRYPPEYAHFKGDDELLDEYDNSILYSDFIQNEVLNIVSSYGGEYLFFADHGLGAPKSSIPLLHDVRDNPSLDSIKVPFFTSPNSSLQLNTDKSVSLYYFECIFSSWSGITASELTKDNYCDIAMNDKKIKFVDTNLNLQQR